MLYKILRPVIKLTLSSYFKNIKVQGKENIPKNKPTIFVANHPSAFMDPLVVAASVKQELHFIAAGEFFGKGIKSWIYKNELNMIPVYRPTTMPEEAHKNNEMFQACHDHLGKGGSILIFPEGNSVTEKRLREIKTGVARIGLGADDAFEETINVQVVPIGLNYSDPHEFRSDLFVNIGKALSCADYKNSEHAVKELTHDIQEALQSVVLHSKDSETESLAIKVERIFKNEIKSNFDLDKNDLKIDYELQKDVIAAVEHFEKTDAGGKNKIESRIDGFLEKIKKLGIDANSLSHKPNNPWDYVKIIFGFPLFLIGFLFNALPYIATVQIARKLNVKSSFFGSQVMGVGMALFLFWYIIGAVFIGLLTNTLWVCPLYLIVAYSSGIFALEYLKINDRIKQKDKFSRLKQKPEIGISSLELERKSIIEDLEKYRLEYVAMKSI